MVILYWMRYLASKDVGRVFYNIEYSPRRTARLKEYYTGELAALKDVPFDTINQDAKIDYLLLKNNLERQLQQLDLEAAKDKETEPLLPFAVIIIRLCEERQRMEPIDAKKAATDIQEITQRVVGIQGAVLAGKIEMDRTTAFRAARTVDRLHKPRRPYSQVDKALTEFANVVREHLVGITPGNEDVIVGDPIGHEGLLAELKAEMLPYTPEELIKIGELEYACFLAIEAVNYVKERDMVTIPPISNECWRMFMMAPVRQKDKLMSMRGNNPHFSRSTVFHELVPGHHLQGHYLSRAKPYRFPIFDTPFSPREPDWNAFLAHASMHKNYLLVEVSSGSDVSTECIDMLVDAVGHERANAEGEVRRSFAGDYSPLYQCGYLLGGLQLYSLRQELVDGGKITQKGFHDRFLKESTIPIELFRALLWKEPLRREFTPSWRFYKGIE
ncbi:hypothetical protein B0O99DRAFT_649540 [Bisporella sp. PMI_857]|nr:hypothetical protein B0O99DRAFT_649540 [Bisporella sp. PMI_857]